MGPKTGKGPESAVGIWVRLHKGTKSATGFSYRSMPLLRKRARTRTTLPPERQ